MFRTKLKISPAVFQIGLKDVIFSIGSCFSVNIGQKLTERKFTTLVNPYGTLFNPHSIFQLVGHSLSGQPLGEELVVQSQEVYYHYLLHGDISSTSKDGLTGQMAETQKAAHDLIHTCNTYLITFGTAITYRHKASGAIVANCHKVPQSEFDRSMMEVEEIVDGFEEQLTKIRALSAGARFVLTVSPVRHLKESMGDNMLSKSVLRLACDKIVKKHEAVDYFPSYEIMMDDLRDYRFYERDMLHPTAVAVDYIWELFMKRYFTDETIKFVKDWEQILTALNHRPFHADTVMHRKFLTNTLDKLNAFEGVVDVGKERTTLEQQLNNG